MKRILNRYERAFGQMVNFDKSLVTFSPNTSEGDHKNVYNQLGVRAASTPGRCLGLPMCTGRNKTTEFGFLLERIEQKLQGWAKYKISKAGKMTLLKTAPQSIPNFWMNLMLIPNEICEKIERRMNSFWRGNEMSRMVVYDGWLGRYYVMLRKRVGLASRGCEILI